MSPLPTGFGTDVARINLRAQPVFPRSSHHSSRPFVVSPMCVRKILLSIASGLIALELVLQAGSLVVFRAATTVDPELSGAARVLCVGDSYTYGLGATATARSYPSVLQDLLRQRLGDEAPQVVNTGWPGQNSNDALRKLDAQLRDNRPVLVCVLLGLNDTWTRPERLEASDLGGAGDGWQLRFRTWRLVQILIGEYGGDEVVTAGNELPGVARAVALMRAGKPEAAVGELERALADDPDNAVEYHQGLVQVQTSLGRRDKAAMSVAWLSAEYQQRPTARVAEAYSVALAAVGERRQSLEVARAATTQFASHSVLWWLLGQGLYDTGDLSAAEEALDRAVATSDLPDHDSLWRATVRRDCARAACARDTCKAVRLLVAAMEFDGDTERCRIIVEGAATSFEPAAVRLCLDAMRLTEDQHQLAARLFPEVIHDVQDPQVGARTDRRQILEVLEHHLHSWSNGAAPRAPS